MRSTLYSALEIIAPTHSLWGSHKTSVLEKPQSRTSEEAGKEKNYF